MIEDSPHTDTEDVEINQPDLELSEVLPEISFHAITGTEHPQTICVLGKLKNKNVTVLIDGGSTHNFIDKALVSRFKLPVTQGKQLQVMVNTKKRSNVLDNVRRSPSSFKGFLSPPITTFFLSQHASWY